MADPTTDPEEPAISLKPLWWVLAGLVICILPFYVLHRNSFCINEGRFVPDAEIIDAAIEEEVRYLKARMSIDGRDIVPFRDKEEFLSRFPNCCKILRGGEERDAYNFNGVMNVLFGYYGSAVEVKYTLEIENAEGRFVEVLARPINVVNSCGVAGIGENDLKRYQIPD